MNKLRIFGIILFALNSMLFSQNLNAELNNLNFSGNGNPKYLAKYNDEIIFSGNRQNFGNELWKFNPVTSSKTLLKKFINNTFISIKSELISFNNKLYFIATDTIVGSFQLWVTDGTPNGTVKVQTIANPSSAFAYQVKFKVVGNKLFFKYSNQLWVSDGTTLGTKKIAQFNEIIGDLYVLGGNVFFTADDGVSGYEIWKSDGTNIGTALLKDINPYNAYGEIVMQPYNNKLYFFSNGNLWESDGTEVGTQVFTNINSVSFKGGIVNGKLLFYTSINELWSTDGTVANTTLLSTINNVSDVFVFKNKLYLDTPTNFIETDGTVSGTQITSDFGNLTTTLDYYSLSLDKNYVIFKKSNQANYTYYSKWISNGNSQTNMLGNSSDENSYVELGNDLYYSGKKDIYDNELFKYNFANNNYENVADVDSWQDSKPRAFKTINDNMFFTAISAGNRQQGFKRHKTTGVITKLSNFDFEIGDINRSISIGNYYYAVSQNSTGIFRTDGTAQNTEFLNIGMQTFSGFYNFDDSTLIFRTKDNNENRIWKVQNDGVPQLLKQNVDNSSAYQITNNSVKIGNNLYFIFKENGISSIYKTDGTTNGTTKISNFSNLSSNSLVDIIGKLNDKILYFKIPNPNSNYSELWISDGTNDGILLQTFNQLPRSESILFNDKLYFIGYYSGFSFLMVSDGTSYGTKIIKQIGSGYSSAYNYDQILPIFSFCGDTLYIANFAYSNSLWKTDGTSLGTVQLAQHSANDFITSYYTQLSCAKNYLYFLNIGSEKIWRTDGTITNTLPLDVTVIKDGIPDIPEQQIQGVPLSSMYSDGDNLFINSYTANNGWELYSITSGLPTYLHSEDIGINNLNQSFLTLYPNPTVEKLFIKLSLEQRIDKIEIYDISGKSLRNINVDKNEINVSNLNTGIYIIKVYIKDKILSGKFIKK